MFYTLTLHQEDSMMFSQGSLHHRNGQQHSLWAQLHTGACWLPDMEESRVWGSGGCLIGWAAETSMKRITPGTKDLWPLCWDPKKKQIICFAWNIGHQNSQLAHTNLLLCLNSVMWNQVWSADDSQVLTCTSELRQGNPSADEAMRTRLTVLPWYSFNSSQTNKNSLWKRHPGHLFYSCKTETHYSLIFICYPFERKWQHKNIGKIRISSQTHKSVITGCIPIEHLFTAEISV